jgi:hypothetical protein
MNDVIGANFVMNSESTSSFLCLKAFISQVFPTIIDIDTLSMKHKYSLKVTVDSMQQHLVF